MFYQARPEQPVRACEGEEVIKIITMTEKKCEVTPDHTLRSATPIMSSVENKYELALHKVGGRLKLTSIIIRRLKELHHADYKQKGTFDTIIEPLLDEIIEGDLTWEEPKKHKK